MMSKHVFCVVIIVVYGGFVRFTEGACVWPSSLASTSWKDNSKGDITFTTDKLSGWGITISAATPPQYYSSWQCYSNNLFVSDNIIIAITQSNFQLYSSTYYGYICLKLRAITSSSYRYYVYSPINNGVNYERVQVSPFNNVTDLQSLCLLKTSGGPASSEYRVMIKTGSGAAVKIDCPYVFLGSYGYTHTDSSSAVTCDPSASIWSTCQDSKEMMFNYSTCPTKVAYSNIDNLPVTVVDNLEVWTPGNKATLKSNAVWCVDTVPSGGNNYVTVYNGYDATSDIDGVNTFLFACFAISSDGTMASVAPYQCRENQVPDTAPKSNSNMPDGAALTMIRGSKTCLTCPAAVAPTSGTVSYSTDGATTNASYTCSSTYSLAGPSTRACESNRTWAGENPTCTCALPASPANGSMTVSTDGTLTYSCNIGFVLNGSRTRVCQNSSNTWSGVQPTCDLCDTINTATGLVTTSSSTGITTVAAFTCKAGYTLNGNTSATCLVSKQWNATAPLCVVCANFSSSSTLNVTLGTDGYTSSATFTCVPGYHVVGSSSATCSKAGVWSSIPTCVYLSGKCFILKPGLDNISECGAQSQPANGTRTGNGSISEFTCQTGYTLIGSSSSVCKTDGTGWSSSTPTCYGCSSLNNTNNGYYTLTTNGLVTLATFSCLSGYTMSGTRTRYCQTNGSWNGTNPTCVKCSDLVNPSSGNFTMWTDGTVSQAYYACATGYNISGSTNTTCKTDGSWTNAAPTCFCSPASKPANGAILSDNGQVVYYKCNLNYSMSGSSVRSCTTNGTGWSGSDPSCVMCGALRAVPGGNVYLTTDDVNSKAAYTCDVGYTISGNKLITCQSDGTWDSAQSNCTKCSNLTTPVGGNYTLQSVDSTVTKATFTCAVGYTLKLYSVLTCKETGAWDNSAPECVLCETRVSPKSGNLTLQTDGLTTTGTYHCATGYTLGGQSTITCRTTGFWNYPEATCTCNNPASPGNGTVAADGLTVTYTCNTGFTLSGSSSGTCKTDGTGWSISTPTCVACESLANFTSGNVTYSSNGSTTMVQYTCPTGASIQGAVTATCNATGKWGTSLPTCVYCPSLPSVSVSTGSVSLTTNGTTTQAHYTCPSGYQVKGSTLLTCNPNGTWSNNASDCVCTTPSAPSGGNFTVSSDGRSILFACGEGYTMAGVPTGTCATDGSGWNISYPSCTKCNSLTTPSNGTVTLVTTGIQTTALFTCGLGYTLSGTAAPVCKSDGTWSSSVTNQTCVSCPSLPNVTIPNGYVSMTTNGTTTTAVYNCPPGYEVKGDGMLTCRTDSTWSSLPSTCVCGKPSVPTGGNYSLSDDGLTVTFACKAGYTISGTQVISCATDGSGWKLSFPNCSRCDNLTLPSGGNVSLVTNGTQTVAVYTCNVGSSLNGVATPTCQDNGTWTSARPTCVTCPTLPAVSVTTGFINLVTDGSLTTAVYNCPAGYEVKGTQNITCRTNGTWSANPSDCMCKTPSNPAGGNYSLSTDGLTVTFACSTGYTMVGTQNISCNTDGSGWNLTQPTCTKCDNLTTPTGGTVTFTTTGTQTTAVYTCGVGYSLKGLSAPKCQTNGSWTAVQPSCVSCPSAVNITNGKLNVTTDGLITRAVYTCTSGYVMDGNAVLTCLTNGSWDSLPPICYCTAPSAPIFGSVSANKTTAVYTCDQGFILKGTAIRTCQDNGLGWTASAPTCTVCDTLTSPKNGSLEFSSNGTVTTVTFSCAVGFSMAGTRTLVCLNDGSWSGNAPTCVQCPALSQPHSGSLVISSNNVTTSANYSCATGYYIVGETHLNCSSTGKWSADSPFCACNNVTAPSNGGVNISVVQGLAQYTCKLGYSINGGATRSCATDGSGWNGSQPSCVGCPAVTATTSGNSQLVSDGTVTSVNFQCDVGATIKGPSALTCQSDGSWTSVQPTCVSCPGLTDPTSGSLNISTDGQLSTASYSCANGYDIDGIATRQCQTDGTWSGTGNTTCVCSAPSDLANGTRNLQNGGLTATYTCDLYFTLKGDRERTCQTDGSGWTGSEPTCVLYNKPSMPVNGNVTITSNGTHTIATYTCNLNYTLKGQFVAVWLPEGRWSSSEPTCVKCSSLTNLASGSIVLSTNGTITMATFTCPNNYYISGNSEISCQENQKWSGSVPECLCDDPSSIANGKLTSDGMTASFQCDVGYSLQGSSGLHCGDNGTGWNTAVPKCNLCTALTTPNSGNKSITTNGINTMATFQCSLGTTLNGSSTLKCYVDGSWNASVPNCVTCEAITPPVSGQYIMSSDGVTTSVRLQCDDGYEAAGQTSVQCGTDGTWKLTQQSTCNEKRTEAGSLLGALIAVVVVSIIIIAVLSILLARFVYLYLQRKKGGEYLSDYDTDKPTSNEYDKFPVPMVKLTSSAAPVNHQRHVMERGVSFAASPAPHGFEKHVIGNGEVPMSPPPVETHRSGTSIISFRRSASNMTEKSVNSISAIKIKDTTSYADTSPRQHVTKSSKSNGVVKHNDKKALLPSPKSNRLAPIANHQQLVGKLGQNPQIKTLQVEDGESGSGRCSPEIRSSTPTMMKHALTVTSYDSKSLDSVSIVEN